MNDKAGKSIKVGDAIRTPDGRTVRVAGILQSKFELIEATKGEVTTAFLGGKGDGDYEFGIVWGS